MHCHFKIAAAAIIAFAAMWTPNAAAQTNVFASSGSGVFTFQLGGPTDGSSHGSFVSGISPASPYRRIVFGADVTGDGTNDLYVGTDSDAIRVFNGTSGVFFHTLGGTATSLRQLAVDPSNYDLYYTAASSLKIGRRDATEAAKPGTGQTGDTFVPVSGGTFSVTIGPDGKVYSVDGATLSRYSTAGGAAENTFALSTSVGAMNFGPDFSGDNLPELYLTQFGTGNIRVIDVFTNPGSWADLGNAVTGLSVPLGLSFIDNDLYVAENGAGRIDRYRLTGGSWLAAPSVGNSGAMFAALADVQDVFIIVPEPSVAMLLVLGSAFWFRRRC